MARIAGINIPNHQHASIALTAIYGIGRARARLICDAAGVKQSAKIKDLTDGEMDKLREQVSRFGVEGDLRREDFHEHQAAHGPRLLPGRAPQEGPAGPRPAHAHQRAHPQGSAQGRAPFQGGCRA